jgi:NodT family efflux transporter outer membrane factor (OMF) lipoprotein
MKVQTILPGFFLGLSVVTAGCTSPREWVHNGFKVGPNYRPPAAATAPQYIAAADPRVQHRAPDDSRWWTVFNDPALDRLVQTAYRQNLPLREACFRILEARAQRAIAIGNIFPQQQQAAADYSRNAVSDTVANRQLIQDRFYGLWDGGFNLAWELDFWGRFRRAVESADAQFSASVDDYDAVLVLLVANVAQTYTQVRTTQDQLAFTRANVALQRKTCELVRTQKANGVATDFDVAQAETSLAQTESLVPPLEISLRQSINQLCVLLGIPPEKLEEQFGPGRIPMAPDDVAVGIPADLLRRRPDVKRAERQLAAQSAQIGIATAQLYPQISIVGTIGLQSSRLAQLANSDSFAGAIGPSMRWDILNYGRLVNGIRQQDARFQELAANYLNTVLVANEEVENGLVAFLKSQEQVKSQTRAAVAAKRAVDLAIIQFQEGIINFNPLFVVEQTLVQQQNQLAQAQGNVALGLIAVYRGLGGGWQFRCENGGTLPAGPTSGPVAPLPGPPANPALRETGPIVPPDPPPPSKKP